MDDQTFFTLMVDLHRDGTRQGPGSDEETLHALELTRLDRAARLQVADIGCGTGASTLALASRLPNARITAVDLFPEFLDILTERACAAGCSEQIETLAQSMDSLPFAAESLDLIWSEGWAVRLRFRASFQRVQAVFLAESPRGACRTWSSSTTAAAQPSSGSRKGGTVGILMSSYSILLSFQFVPFLVESRRSRQLLTFFNICLALAAVLNVLCW